MRSVLIGLVALAVSAVPVAATAGAPPTLTAYPPNTTAPGVDAVGKTAIGATVYRSRDEAARLPLEVRSTDDGPVVALRRPDNLLGAAREAADNGGGPRRKYLPVVLSVLVPGAGEVSMGYYKRGIALMAIEAGAWTGYFYKHNQGLDTRREYEAFADAHWDMQRWIDNHYLIYPSTGQTLADLEAKGKEISGSGVWPGYSPWVPKSADKQHYYENIGKYDWYVSGWEDYIPGTAPTDLGPGEVLSRLREQYRDMRHKSNQQLDASDRFVYFSIAARVFSLVETTLLVRGSSDQNDHAGATLDNRWILSARSRGYDASEVALEYWFK